MEEGRGVKKTSGGRFCSCHPNTNYDEDDGALNTHGSLPLPLVTDIDTDNW
jgi:hypothetical protein